MKHYIYCLSFLLLFVSIVQPGERFDPGGKDAFGNKIGVGHDRSVDRSWHYLIYLG